MNYFLETYFSSASYFAIRKLREFRAQILMKSLVDWSNKITTLRSTSFSRSRPVKSPCFLVKIQYLITTIAKEFRVCWTRGLLLRQLFTTESVLKVVCGAWQAWVDSEDAC